VKSTPNHPHWPQWQEQTHSPGRDKEAQRLLTGKFSQWAALVALFCASPVCLSVSVWVSVCCSRNTCLSVESSLLVCQISVKKLPLYSTQQHYCSPPPIKQCAIQLLQWESRTKVHLSCLIITFDISVVWQTLLSRAIYNKECIHFILLFVRTL
jgi:hypothetical protein